MLVETPYFLDTPLPSPGLLQRISGLEGVTLQEVAAASQHLLPESNRRLDTLAQAMEMVFIRDAADLIEGAFRQRGLTPPTVFTFLTGGIHPPAESELLGTYGDPKGYLRGFLQADIGGHLGQAYALGLGPDQSALYFAGRAHPYSGVGKPFAEMEYARPLNVVKEIVRRGRERGQESMVVLTYLTGVSENSPVKPGGLGIVVDYTERAGGRAGLSAGSGPHYILDETVGARFQLKMGRGSDQQLAQLFFDLSRRDGIDIGFAVAVGTQNTTSFQGYLDVGGAETMFQAARAHGLDEYVQKTYGRNARLSLFYDMSLAFEADLLRQIIIRTNPANPGEDFVEADIPLLIVVFPTDSVGKGSLTVSHATVIRESMSKAPRNQALLEKYTRGMILNLPTTHPVPQVPDWVGPLPLARILPRELV